MAPIRSSQDGPKDACHILVVHTKTERDAVRKLTFSSSLRTLNPLSGGPSVKPSRSRGSRTKAKTPRAATHRQAAAGAVRRSRRGDAAKDHDEQIGHYRVEITDSKKIWCGKFALAISTREQLGAGHELTLRDFDEVYFGEKCRAFNKRRGWSDITNDFYDEQLDYVLRVWGQNRGLRLRLGVKKDYEGTYPCATPSELQGVEEKEREAGLGTTTVWVHNDNAMVCLGRPYNHYSGISMVRD